MVQNTFNIDFVISQFWNLIPQKFPFVSNFYLNILILQTILLFTGMDTNL